MVLRIIHNFKRIKGVLCMVYRRIFLVNSRIDQDAVERLVF